MNRSVCGLLCFVLTLLCALPLGAATPYIAPGAATGNTLQWSPTANGGLGGYVSVAFPNPPPLTLSAINAALGYTPLDAALLQLGTAAGQTLRWDGSKWARATNLTNDGTDLRNTGDIYARFFESTLARSGFYTDGANNKGYWDTTASGVNWLNVSRVPGNVNVAIQAAAGQTAPTLEGLNSTGAADWLFNQSGNLGVGPLGIVGGKVNASGDIDSFVASQTGSAHLYQGFSGGSRRFDVNAVGRTTLGIGTSLGQLTVYGLATIPASVFQTGSADDDISQWVKADGTQALKITGTGVLSGASATGTDTPGADLTLAGGTGTGNATPGAVVIKAATPGVSGTTAQALGDVARFTSAGTTLTGAFKVLGNTSVLGGSIYLDNSQAIYTKDNSGNYNRAFFSDSANNMGWRNEQNGGAAIYGISYTSPNASGLVDIQTASVPYAILVRPDGKVGLNTNNPLAQFHVLNADPSQPVTTFVGAAGQTALMTKWQSSTGTTLMGVTSNGCLDFGLGEDGSPMTLGRRSDGRGIFLGDYGVSYPRLSFDLYGRLFLNPSQVSSLDASHIDASLVVGQRPLGVQDIAVLQSVDGSTGRYINCRQSNGATVMSVGADGTIQTQGYKSSDGSVGETADITITSGTTVTLHVKNGLIVGHD